MSININDVFELCEAPVTFNEEQFELLWHMKPMESQQCKIFGKTIDVPRKYAVYGAQYSFGGQENSPVEVPLILEPFLEFGNSILLNWYEDGSKYIGYHSDDERGLKGCVYGFSYGASRKFKFQNKKTKEVDTIVLENNSLVIMKENTQKTHKHSLPVMKNVSERRISVTVRTIKY
jgi:hypothetical protein